MNRRRMIANLFHQGRAALLAKELTSAGYEHTEIILFSQVKQ